MIHLNDGCSSLAFYLLQPSPLLTGTQLSYHSSQWAALATDTRFPCTEQNQSSSPRTRSRLEPLRSPVYPPPFPVFLLWKRENSLTNTPLPGWPSTYQTTDSLALPPQPLQSKRRLTDSRLTQPLCLPVLTKQEIPGFPRGDYARNWARCRAVCVMVLQRKRCELELFLHNQQFSAIAKP